MNVHNVQVQTPKKNVFSLWQQGWTKPAYKTWVAKSIVIPWSQVYFSSSNQVKHVAPKKSGSFRGIFLAKNPLLANHTYIYHQYLYIHQSTSICLYIIHIHNYTYIYPHVCWLKRTPTGQTSELSPPGNFEMLSRHSSSGVSHREYNLSISQQVATLNIFTVKAQLC